MIRKERTNTAYPQKPNGSMPAGLAHKQDVSLVRMSQNSTNTPGMLETRALKLMQLAARNQTPGDFMTYMGMSGNGCKMSGMIITMVLLQMGVYGKKEMVSIGFLVGVAGSVIRDSAVRLAVSNASLKVVLLTLDFDC